MSSTRIIQTNNAPAAIGPYSQAVLSTGTVGFISGQLGIDPETGELVSNDFSDQVRQAIENLTQIVKAAGGDLSHIVKLTLFLTDLNNFGLANSLMSELLPSPYPARSTFEVSALPKGGLFEVEAIMTL